MHALPYKLRRLEFPVIAFNSTQHVQMLVENEERLLDFESNHLIPWDHWPAKPDPYQPECVSTQSQVEEARSEAAWIGTFYQSQARSALVPGSSGDGQDPDDNRGPPGRQLPQDKVGGNDSDSDKEEEERRKKEEESRLVRVTKIVVRNSNQVHVVPSTSQQLVTVVSCDSPNNNLYHQRVIEAIRRDTSHAINVDNIRVSSEPPSRRPSASTSVNEVVDVDSHETSHSSIAEALHNLVTTTLYKIFFSC